MKKGKEKFVYLGGGKDRSTNSEEQKLCGWGKKEKNLCLKRGGTAQL